MSKKESKKQDETKPEIKLEDLPVAESEADQAKGGGKYTQVDGRVSTPR